MTEKNTERVRDGVFLCGVCEVEDAPKMWREIGDRETGKIRPNLLANRIKWNRIERLQLSDHKDIVTPHRGSINSLQVLFFFFPHSPLPCCAVLLSLKIYIDKHYPGVEENLIINFFYSRNFGGLPVFCFDHEIRLI